ncbi:LysR family transcriptional regulator [Janthinobacterium sp. CG_23.3]|uniref:helix-turn-helix domain-containing protein n=1 Tax=Janthinobacterium sp. CG_23.3 TaxID=3349634 RepID=UPI0038D472CC
MERNIALDQLNFRLLNVFVALFRERHVGRAADALGMSQPTVSTLLARLRQVAGDPLFIRSAKDDMRVNWCRRGSAGSRRRFAAAVRPSAGGRRRA